MLPGAFIIGIVWGLIVLLILSIPNYNKKPECQTVHFIQMNAEQATINHYISMHNVNLIQIIDRERKTGIWVAGCVDDF